MTSDEIRQMFRAAADLRKMGPFDKEREEAERRFAELDARYRAECLGSAPPVSEKEPSSPDWESALRYLAGLFQQMDAAMPETAPMNKAAWAVIAPAVQKFYEGGNAGKNGEPAE